MTALRKNVFLLFFVNCLRRLFRHRVTSCIFLLSCVVWLIFLHVIPKPSADGNNQVIFNDLPTSHDEDATVQLWQRTIADNNSRETEKEIVYVYITPEPEQPLTPEIKIETRIVKELVYVTSPPQTARTDKIEYITVEGYDYFGGDSRCETEKCFHINVINPEMAKLLCDGMGTKCLGFVYHEPTGEVHLKDHLDGKFSPQSQSLAFFKSNNSTGLKIPPSNKCASADLTNTEQEDESVCKLPDFNPFDDDVMKLISEVVLIQCPGRVFTSYERSVLKLQPDTADVNITAVSYQTIRRNPQNDNEIERGNKTYFNKSQEQVQLKDDFISVEVQTAKEEKFVEVHAKASTKPEVLERKVKQGLPLNVAVIGFDSTSYAHFKRVFSKVESFMKTEMNSVFFDGHSIVGDGTTPALTAILTGVPEVELPEARRGYKNAQTVDNWPWIFKQLHSQGYATLFSEDAPGYGSFNYRLMGFKDPPADHYGRPFWIGAKTTRRGCIHSQSQASLQYNYLKSLYDAYPDNPKFGFIFLTDLCHRNLNSLGQGEEEFFNFLQILRDGNYLNNTMLVVMSDHGFRYGESRATLQGKFEETLPILSITLPPWFKKLHPDLYSNLKENTKKLTSPFDLHATFSHILSYPELPRNLSYGKSLFDKISKTRTCSDCGIPDYYCPCVRWRQVSSTHDHIKHAVEQAVGYINNLTSSDPTLARLCERLVVKEILQGHQSIANKKFQSFLHHKDVDGRKAAFAEDEIHPGECSYIIQFRTEPGDGLFEAPVGLLDGQFRLTGEISRINMYGDQSSCISEQRPDLRKYCYCKTFRK